MLKQINYGERLRIGLILPNRNIVAEPDFRAVLPEGVSFHTTRLHLRGTTPTDIIEMTNGVGKAAHLLSFNSLGLIAFHCTAVSTFNSGMGDRLTDEIASITGIPAVATSQALVASLLALNARRIVMVTPYSQDVNDAEIRFFSDFGIEVITNVGMSLGPGVSTASIEPEKWMEITMQLKTPEADAYFLSCTNIRVLSVIDQLEKQLSAPVITSNQAMLWHCLRKAGILDSVQGHGVLLRSH